ncbi:zinc finger protein 512B [Pseudoliparis swirei]|uniref:zinc finger protein 512B n=1 Tax=Pseudoliparis swirei TaxID=2059687 RepID=UPI0024BD6D1E|nr:zinc finger protein 512B [Pseudoliparis swirei]
MSARAWGEKKMSTVQVKNTVSHPSGQNLRPAAKNGRNSKTPGLRLSGTKGRETSSTVPTRGGPLGFKLPRPDSQREAGSRPLRRPPKLAPLELPEEAREARRRKLKLIQQEVEPADHELDVRATEPPAGQLKSCARRGPVKAAAGCPPASTEPLKAQRRHTPSRPGGTRPVPVQRCVPAKRPVLVNRCVPVSRLVPVECSVPAKSRVPVNRPVLVNRCVPVSRLVPVECSVPAKSRVSVNRPVLVNRCVPVSRLVPVECSVPAKSRVPVNRPVLVNRCVPVGHLEDVVACRGATAPLRRKPAPPTLSRRVKAQAERAAEAARKNHSALPPPEEGRLRLRRAQCPKEDQGNSNTSTGGLSADKGELGERAPRVRPHAIEKASRSIPRPPPIPRCVCNDLIGWAHALHEASYIVIWSREMKRGRCSSKKI